ncbi:uncharacterized protein LOC142241881 [Haematobia irritans]|uniref:uncharacterized protein LOC142224001 n=1 Tax=Haematobia irritans TaxID=7368 RepID=UPI003F4FF9CB
MQLGHSPATLQLNTQQYTYRNFNLLRSTMTLGNICLESLAPRNPNIHQCLLCSRYHSLRFCRKFLGMDIGARRREVRRLGYCMNCLARSHKSYDCISEVACKECGGEHHTLLHLHPVPRLTEEQMRGRRVPSDMRHLLTRINRERSPANHQKSVHRQSRHQHSLNQRNIREGKTISHTRSTSDHRKNPINREPSQTPYRVTRTEDRSSAIHSRVLEQIHMVQIAIRALHRLNDALTD